MIILTIIYMAVLMILKNALSATVFDTGMWIGIISLVVESIVLGIAMSYAYRDA